MSETRVSRRFAAPPAAVYSAFLDPVAVARWKVPSQMRAEVHDFDGREGGRYRISLTYDAADREGKTSAHTDTYSGRFVRLVPDALVVEVDEFETADPAMQGEMTITVTLTATPDGTELLAVHEGLPPGVAPEDNEIGWREALDRLAALVEGSAGDH